MPNYNPSNSAIPTLIDPQLTDNTLMQINAKLIDELSWLDYAYGKCQRLVETVDGSDYFKPAIYTGGSKGTEYLTLTPDEHKGQFCFWDLNGTEQPSQAWTPHVYHDLDRGFGLVFFGRIDKVYPTTWRTKTIENIKRDILNVLLGVNILGGSFTITSIEERHEDILTGFSHEETNNQYLMTPYFGLRFNGNLRIRVICEPTPT